MTLKRLSIVNHSILNYNKRRFQLQFIRQLVLFLSNGFSMQESLRLMIQSKQFTKLQLEQINQLFLQGFSIDNLFKKLNFSAQIIAQIQLAQVHGNLLITLNAILQQLQQQRNRQKQLQQILIYPLMLVLFLFLMLLLMRFILLPQFIQSGLINKKQWTIRLFYFMPYMVGGSIFLIGLIYLSYKNTWKRKDYLIKMKMTVQLPIIGQFVRLYYTSFFATEWGLLLQQGLELKQIIQCMQNLEDTSFMYSLAKDIEKHLAKGWSLKECLAIYSFFTPEFSIILFQGEITGKLGKELSLYGQLLLERLQQKLQTWMQFIQPLIFVIVALLVLAVYLMVLLPVYQQMDVYM